MVLPAVTFASWYWVPGALNILVLLVGIFLILLVLIQKGKGGGLAGAFGGTGGSSAFGSRAGDQFTRVTIVVAAVWIALIMIMVVVLPHFPRDDRGNPKESSIHRWRPHPTRGQTQQALADYGPREERSAS